MREWQSMGGLLAVAITVLLTLASVLAITNARTAQADVNDDDAHLGFLGPDGDEEHRGPKYLTRNLVDGRLIPVCSTEYPIATPKAIELWNTALGINVFQFMAVRDACDTKQRRSPRRGVVSLTVTKGSWTNEARTTYQGKVLSRACSRFAWGGCAGPEYGNRHWRTYYGRAEIVMHPQNRGVDGNDALLIRDIAHEMGHILALADYFCHVDGYAVDVSQHPDRIDPPWFRTLLNSFTARAQCNSPDGRPTQRDIIDYQAIYLPAAATGLAGIAKGQTVTLTWSQSNTFAESGFEIQKWDGAKWAGMVIVAPNETSVELTDQRGGVARYRVVSVTKALPPSEAGHGHTHGLASEEVAVTLKFPVPGNPRVATPGADSLNFEWDEVVGADGYDVRRIGRPDSSTCDSTAEEQATVSGSPPGRSHRFATGLKAATEYLLCVRATKAGYPDVTSDWASTRATTKSRSVTPPQPTTKTCPDGTVVQINQPCSRPQKPAPVVETQRARQTTEYQWRLYGDGIPGARPPNPPGTCYIELYQRERYVLTEFEIPWRWDARQSKWVLDRANQKQVGLESDFIYTHWRAAGDRRDLTCPGAGGDSNGANAPATPEIGMLLPGDYVTAWDGERYSFTIPDGLPVNLETRRVGEQDVMVFSLATGVALAIVPPQAIADPPVVDDPTLAAIVRSFQLEPDPANLPTGQERDRSETCVEPPDRAGDGALSLNLDAQWCLVVRGGDVTVQSGTDRIALTLPAERVWLVMAAPRSGTTEASAFRIIDRQTKSQLVLDPVSGAELSRRITDGADALGELFDAMVPKGSDDSS